jgi:predicted methyltransferase
MNKAIYDSLKPGGSFVVVDHRAADGSGLAHTNTLHRIEESVVRKEVEDVGFKFVKDADFLNHPADDRSGTAVPQPQTLTDRFVHLYHKPN